MKVKLTQAGWEDLNGWFGAFEFVDGVSVKDLNPAECNRLRACVGCDIIERDEGYVPMNADYSEIKSAEAPVGNTIQPVDPEELEKKLEKDKQSLMSRIANAIKSKEVEKVWTAEELEAIADDEGIAGLRRIADPMGVKGKAIQQLIDDILKEQAK